MREPIRWTTKLLAHLARLKNDHGLPYAVIADRMSASYTAIKRVFRKRIGVKPRVSVARAWTREDVERAIDAQMDGESIKSIAKMLGRSHHSVTSKLRKERKR